MPFVRVIPLLRTPLGVEAFDYSLPAGLDAVPGDLVTVPFRHQSIPALVAEILDDSPYAAKALPLIGRYADIRFPKSLLGLLEWTAARTFCSKPTVLKAWLRTLPKKSTCQAGPVACGTPPFSPGWPASGRGLPSGTTRLVKTHLEPDPQKKLVERALDVIHQGGHVLILTPWKSRVDFFKNSLTDSAVLHSDLNDGDAFRAWHSFYSGKNKCLIATRLGAWLTPLADLVLLDEPENDDYKQDELAPRYDARLMAEWCATNTDATVESFGLTPVLGSDEPAPTIALTLHTHVRHPHGRSEIPAIQADTLNALLEHDGPRVIVHPIRGTASRFVCRDCGWRAVCAHCGFGLSAENDRATCRACGKKFDSPVVCPSCGGADLGKAMPGIEKLKTAWQEKFPDKPVDWRDLSSEQMDAPLSVNTMVVVTDGGSLGGGEDVRRREKQCLAFRRLADRVAASQGTLIIQCDESLAGQWSNWLTADGLKTFQDKELAERKAFGYPPAVRLVKLIYTSVEAPAAPSTEAQSIRGPFPVAYRPSSRQNRFIYHLIFDRATDESVLLERLAALAKSAIIDLDPIAFFK